MNALEAGEALAAEGAVAPRVTLDGMKARISEEYYAVASEALAGQIPEEYNSHPLDTLTICFLVLDNGWTLLGKSAPASPDNFDEEKGRIFAYEDAIRQLWPLEGYLLRDRLAADEEIA